MGQRNLGAYRENHPECCPSLHEVQIRLSVYVVPEKTGPHHNRLGPSAGSSSTFTAMLVRQTKMAARDNPGRTIEIEVDDDNILFLIMVIVYSEL